MQLFAFLAALLACCLGSFLLYCYHTSKFRHSSPPRVPPGSLGLPFVGETLQFLRRRIKKPQSFSSARKLKYGEVFKTSIFGIPTVISDTPDFHRMLFSNENKLVVNTWPKSVIELEGNGALMTKIGNDAKSLRSAIMVFLRAEALQKYIDRVDSTAQQHLETWTGREEVLLYPDIKQFAFRVACDVFMSLKNQLELDELLEPFNRVMEGLIQLPICLPGTRFYKAKTASKELRKKFRIWIEKRRTHLKGGTNVCDDCLTCLLNYKDDNGNHLTVEEIQDNILMLLLAGHDTVRVLITMMCKCLAENKWCYEEVLKEQLAIAAEKGPGEQLSWKDVQKMKFSWRVAQETLRLYPPSGGGFREAVQDFEFRGYAIPKGWRLFWSVNLHKDPMYFPDPEKFDPARFEGAGPPPYTFLPFGGGHRMCPGNEFARMNSMVFLHHLVKKYRWSLACPDEKVVIDPMPRPAEGLPITLVRREHPPIELSTSCVCNDSMSHGS